MENFSSTNSPHMADDYSLSLFRGQKHKHRRRRRKSKKKKKCKKRKKCKRKRKKKRKRKSDKRFKKKKGKKVKKIQPIADERFLVWKPPIIDNRMNHLDFEQQTLIKTPQKQIKRLKKGKMRAIWKRGKRENG